MPSRHLCEHEQEIITHGAARWQLSNDGRKAMTNLDSVLKSRDITLLINIHIVKAMVIQVVVYGCESWTIKKDEHQRIDVLNCDVGEDS